MGVELAERKLRRTIENMSKDTKSIQKKPTIRQKRAAKLVIENVLLDKPLTDGEIVANSGYGESMSKNPQVILNSEGVQTELERLGFTENNAKEVVGEILSNKSAQDKDRLKAADMVFDVFGTKAPLKSLHIQVNLENRTFIEHIAQKAIEEVKNGESNG